MFITDIIRPPIYKHVVGCSHPNKPVICVPVLLSCLSTLLFSNLSSSIKSSIRAGLQPLTCYHILQLVAEQ